MVYFRYILSGRFINLILPIAKLYIEWIISRYYIGIGEV